MRYLLMSLLALMACATGSPSGGPIDTDGEPLQPPAVDGSVVQDAGGQVDSTVYDGSATSTDAQSADAPSATADAAALDAASADAAALDASPDAATPDAGIPDAATPDAATPDAAIPDAAMPDAAIPDAAIPDAIAPADAGHTIQYVHIFIDNACNVSTFPSSLSVPSGGTVNIQWYNHSTDYAADIWMSYGGGSLALPEGEVWGETHTWCTGSTIYSGTADIGPAGVPTSTCQHVYFPIHCL